MADVFISYARADRPRAEYLVKALEREGFSAWMDVQAQAESRFAELLNQLDACKAVLMIWSPQAFQSDWVMRECKHAAASGKLIPASFEDISGIDVPPEFRLMQRTTLAIDADDPQSIALLAERVWGKVTPGGHVRTPRTRLLDIYTGGSPKRSVDLSAYVDAALDLARGAAAEDVGGKRSSRARRAGGVYRGDLKEKGEPVSVKRRFGRTPEGLHSVIRNLAGVLGQETRLSVPRYQRPYSWTQAQVRQVISDLRRAHQQQAPFYFIGQIVLVAARPGELEVTDGQARLATLSILLAYVRDRLPARADAYARLILANGDGRPRFRLREEDQAFFEAFVQRPGRTSDLAAMPVIGVDSRDALAGAARAVVAELGDVDDSELGGFADYTARCLTFNVVEAAERGCAQTVFNTMNMRGRPLQEMDVLKSDLLENTDLSDDERQALARRWESVEDQLSRETFSRLVEVLPLLLGGRRLSPTKDFGAFMALLDERGGVRRFFFQDLPRYAWALQSICAANVQAGSASDEINWWLQQLRSRQDWPWIAPAVAFLAARNDAAENGVRFFSALEQLLHAADEGALDHQAAASRFDWIASNIEDDAKVFAPGALTLTEQELKALRARVTERLSEARARMQTLINTAGSVHGDLSVGGAFERRVSAAVADLTVEHVLPGRAVWAPAPTGGVLVQRSSAAAKACLAAAAAAMPVMMNRHSHAAMLINPEWLQYWGCAVDFCEEGEDEASERA